MRTPQIGDVWTHPTRNWVTIIIKHNDVWVGPLQPTDNAYEHREKTTKIFNQKYANRPIDDNIETFLYNVLTPVWVDK